MSFERLCKIVNRLPLPTYAPKGIKEDLERACKFLATRNSVSPDCVISSAYLMALVSFISSFFVLYLLSQMLFLTVLVSVLLTLLAFYVTLLYPIMVMDRLKLMLSEQSDLMFEQFALVFQSGGTIFDGIEMIAQSQHPFLSEAFQGILGKIQRGIPPEKALMDFANNQPSQDMRRYIITILSTMERDHDLLDMVSGESYEADMTLRQKNMELESRLLITTALLTYLPLVAVLALALTGTAGNSLVLLQFPAFASLTLFLSRRFSNRYTTYFDTPRETGIRRPSQNEVIEEYDEFLNFLILIGERLSLGDTLEVAFFEVRDNVGKEVQRLLDPALLCLNTKNCSLEEAISKASEQALGARVAQILRLLILMVNSSAKDAGARLRKIGTRLIQRSEVAKERDMIIAAQRMKVYILTITSSLVLGFLTALAPFLSLNSLLSPGIGFVWKAQSIVDIFPLIITMVSTNAFTSYQTTKMVEGDRPILIALISGMVYLISLSLATSFIGINFGLE